MAIMTFALASKLSRDYVDRALHYCAVEEDDIMKVFPLVFWPQGTSATYKQLKTLPTSAWRIETDAITSTQADYDTWQIYLKGLATQMQVPLANMQPLSDLFNQRQANMEAMAISMGKEFRTTLADGCSVTATVGANIQAGAKGWVRVKMGPNAQVGLWHVEFDDAPTNRIRIKAPNDTNFGAWQVTAGDLDEVALYSEDTTQYLWVVFDESDSEAGGDYTTTSLGGANADGILVASSKEPDGLTTLIHPTMRTWGNLTASPNAAGHALALSQLDWLLDQVPGPKSEMLFMMPKRTRRSYKALILAAGALEYVDTWMGMKLDRRVLSYEGVPIWVSDHIPQNQTAGLAGTATTCTSVHLVRVNPSQGFSCFYWNAGPPAVRVLDNGAYVPVPLPFYNRIVNGENAEMETLPDQLFRMDTFAAPFMNGFQCHAEVCGINN
jgi:hypothetical protein